MEEQQKGKKNRLSFRRCKNDDTLGVNFINILRTHFSYESPFFAKTYQEKSTVE